MPKGRPWSIEEDRIVRSNLNTEDCIQELAEHGYSRTGQAILSRRKALMRAAAKGDPVALGQERADLEAELTELEGRLRQVRRRLLEVRVAQVKEAAGDVELPEEVYAEIRKRLAVD